MIICPLYAVGATLKIVASVVIYQGIKLRVVCTYLEESLAQILDLIYFIDKRLALIHSAMEPYLWLVCFGVFFLFNLAAILRFLNISTDWTTAT